MELQLEQLTALEPDLDRLLNELTLPADQHLQGAEEYCDWLERAASAKVAWQHCSIFPATGTFTPQNLSDITTAITRSKTHLLAYHESFIPHFHWLHPCRSIGRGHSCDCGARGRLRSLDFPTKLTWFKHPGTYEALRKSVFYLQMGERRIISSRYDGQTGLLFSRESGDQINWGDTRGWREKDQDLEQHIHDGPPDGFEDCGSVFDSLSGKRKNLGPIGAAPKRATTKLQEATLRVKEVIRKHRPMSCNHLQDLEDFSSAVQCYEGYPSRIRDIIACAWDAVTRENKTLPFRQLIVNLEQSTLNTTNYLSLDDSYNVVCHLLNQQFQDPLDFLSNIVKIMDKTMPKVNTMSIVGPAGCGKTYFFETLAQLAWTTGRPVSTFNKHAAFPFDDCLNKRLLLFNELSIAESHIDMLKSVFEGSLTTINCKYERRAILQRTPCIVTTNNNFILDLPHEHQDPYNQRIIRYTWTAQPWLKNVHFYPHPLVWKQLFNHVVTQTSLPTFETHPVILSNQESTFDYIF